MYKIIWSASAEKELRKLEHGVARRIYSKVGSLSADPYRNAIKLIGEKGYRIRIGDYRVLYDVDSKTVSILILKVGNRSSMKLQEANRKVKI